MSLYSFHWLFNVSHFKKGSKCSQMILLNMPPSSLLPQRTDYNMCHQSSILKVQYGQPRESIESSISRSLMVCQSDILALLFTVWSLLKQVKTISLRKIIEVVVVTKNAFIPLATRTPLRAAEVLLDLVNPQFPKIC